MVEKAIGAAYFAAKSCKADDAVVVIIFFIALGLVAGFFIGSCVTP
jgi:hypothetical protein